MFDSAKRFGQTVSHHIVCIEVADDDITLCQVILDEVVAHVDVLCAFVEARVLCKVNRSAIIFVNLERAGISASVIEVGKQLLQPEYLFDAFTEGNILGFARGQGDDGL